MRIKSITTESTPIRIGDEFVNASGVNLYDPEINKPNQVTTVEAIPFFNQLVTCLNNFNSLNWFISDGVLNLMTSDQKLSEINSEIPLKSELENLLVSEIDSISEKFQLFKELGDCYGQYNSQTYSNIIYSRYDDIITSFNLCDIPSYNLSLQEGNCYDINLKPNLFVEFVIIYETDSGYYSEVIGSSPYGKKTYKFSNDNLLLRVDNGLFLLSKSKSSVINNYLIDSIIIHQSIDATK